jgi:hypothetical protein
MALASAERTRERNRDDAIVLRVPIDTGPKPSISLPPNAAIVARCC